MKIKSAIGVILTALTLLQVQPALGTNLIYEYDANGNLISGDGKYFEYNEANKLVRVRHGDAAGPVIAEYVYDYNGQRVKKIENGVTTYYLGKHFEKQVGGSQPGNTSYYFANGQRVARKNTAGNVFYYHTDHLGGTNAMTNSTGNMVERTRYYPFGEIREGGAEQYTYTGKERDKASDFYYFEARHYHAGYRHFTQPDAIDPDLYDPQSLNRYAYVENNPLKYVDPSGEKIADAFGTKELVVAGAGMVITTIGYGITPAAPQFGIPLIYSGVFIITNSSHIGKVWSASAEVYKEQLKWAEQHTVGDLLVFDNTEKSGNELVQDIKNKESVTINMGEKDPKNCELRFNAREDRSKLETNWRKAFDNAASENNQTSLPYDGKSYHYVPDRDRVKDGNIIYVGE